MQNGTTLMAENLAMSSKISNAFPFDLTISCLVIYPKYILAKIQTKYPHNYSLQHYQNSKDHRPLKNLPITDMFNKIQQCYSKYNSCSEISKIQSAGNFTGQILWAFYSKKKKKATEKLKMEMETCSKDSRNINHSSMGTELILILI